MKSNLFKACCKINNILQTKIGNQAPISFLSLKHVTFLLSRKHKQTHTHTQSQKSANSKIFKADACILFICSVYFVLCENSNVFAFLNNTFKVFFYDTGMKKLFFIFRGLKPVKLLRSIACHILWNFIYDILHFCYVIFFRFNDR
jgi:hypothetical protein